MTSVESALGTIRSDFVIFYSDIINNKDESKSEISDLEDIFN